MAGATLLSSFETGEESLIYFRCGMGPGFSEGHRRQAQSSPFSLQL